MFKDDNEITTHVVDNAIFLPQVVTLIAEGHTVTLPLRGYSMRPFLENERDKALLAEATDIREGDVVLAELYEGYYVLHRIVAIRFQDVTLLGDGNLTKEYCQLDDIRAKAIGFYRKNRTKPDLTDGMKWRLYSWIWTRLFPIRRYLLFALHPHIPNRWKKGNKVKEPNN